MSEPFIAEVKIFAGNFAPRGFAFCNGQLVPIAQNTALFAIVGTIYGGDGRTTFGLPNLQGRAPMHPGNGPGLTSRRLGEVGGAQTVTLQPQHLPVHSHTLRAATNATSPSPGSGVAYGTAPVYNSSGSTLAMAGNALGSVGGGSVHNNLQPFLAVNFVIATIGTFPTPN